MTPHLKIARPPRAHTHLATLLTAAALAYAAPGSTRAAQGASEAASRGFSTATAEVAGAIAKGLRRGNPQAQPDAVHTTPIAGLYEVRLGTQMLYTDATGTLVIQGSMVDLAAQQNLTEARLARATAVPHKELELLNSIVNYRSGDGSRQLVIFADPNCGYCKQLESELRKLTNVTVRTIVIPILGESSKDVARNIMCSPNPGATWHEWMANGVTPPAAAESCTTPQLAANSAYAAKLGIRATPTMFMPDGSRIPGAAPAERLEQLLASAPPSGSRAPGPKTKKDLIAK